MLTRMVEACISLYLLSRSSMMPGNIVHCIHAYDWNSGHNGSLLRRSWRLTASTSSATVGTTDGRYSIHVLCSGS